MPWTVEKRLEARERGLERWANWRAAGLVSDYDPAALRAKYRAETLANRVRIEAILYAPENIWKPRPKPLKAKPRKVWVSRAKITLAYPYLPKARDEHADLIAVNALVPSGMPGREDVCQEILLAILEKQITIDELRNARGNVREFMKRFRRDNMEAGGFAISLDAPMSDGRSWHDVLSA